MMYKHSASVTMYVCLHPLFSYSGSYLLNLCYDMSMRTMMLEEYCADNSSPFRPGGTAAQQCSIDSALLGMEQKYAMSHRSDDRHRSEIRSAVLDWTLLIIELSEIGAERLTTQLSRCFPATNLTEKKFKI